MVKVNKEELHSIFVGIKDGNELEFNKLYEKYKGLVYGVAFSILKSKEDSEEVVQAIFMKIFKLEKTKLPKEKEASWLYTFSKNESINFLKRKKENLNIEDIYYIRDKEDKIEEFIDVDSYNKIIGRLNKKEQEVVSLRILSGLTFKEISQMLNIPIGTVQWRYYKSLNTLKIILSNLSMFILTIAVFIMQKKTGEKSTENIEKGDIQNAEEQKVEIQSDNELRKEFEGDSSQDGIINNQAIENAVAGVEEKGGYLTKVDIGILSVAFVFLVVTIIFLIKFVRNQQKTKKRLSK